MRQQRQAERLIYNVHDLLADLKYCSTKRDLQWGRRIHAKAVETRYDSNMYVLTALIKMYGKCGSMVDARLVFDSIQKQSVVAWTALLLGYAENGEGHVALELFSRMKNAHGCAPDPVTYVAAIKACTSLAVNGDVNEKLQLLERGRQIHLEIDSSHLDRFVQSALIDMYANCSSMIDARQVFDNIGKPDVVSWTALILGYANNGEGYAALELFSRMSGCSPNPVTYVAALKACTSLVNGDASGNEECLLRGREIHSKIGCNLDHYVKSTLIDMYAKCGSMVEARQVFDSIRKPDVVSWSALILGYAEVGEGHAALNMFSRMKAASGCAPNAVTYVAALKACTSLAISGNGSGKEEGLEWGKEIHLEVGRHLNLYVQNTLVDMYANCGSMLEARRVFDSIQKRDVVSWTSLIMGYAMNGEGKTALDMFSRMKAVGGCTPNSVTYIASLKACSLLAVNGDGENGDCLELGREIHSEIGGHLNHYVQNTLIDMYANCSSIIDAVRVFDSIRKPDVVSWNALILGYAENGEGHAALDLFSRMRNTPGSVPNSVTYLAALKACGLIGALVLGRKLHSEISEFTPNVLTSLVDFYAKCGSLVEACEVFDLHPKLRIVSTWNALLTGYGSFGDNGTVFKLFETMQDQGFQPDAVTFVCVLSCCSHAGLVEKAREYFEAMSVQYGITPTEMHYTCMVDVLGRSNQLNEAIAVLQRMPFSPSAVTWMTLLGACGKWKNVEIGRWAFRSLEDMGQINAPAYILMAHIYGSRGMLEEQERMLESTVNFHILGEAYVTDEMGKIVRFMAGEEDPPGVKDKLEQLLEDIMKEHSYVAETYCCNLKKKAVCGHSERRAVAYSILNTPHGEAVRAFKKTRMCDNCHGIIKMISKLCERIVMVRDATKLHVMVNGRCSCGDCW